MSAGLALFGLANWAAGQSPACTVQDVPAYRGLSLGMTRKQLRAKLPGANPDGVLDRERLSRVQGFSGLTSLAYRVSAEDTLYEIDVRYAGLSGGMERLTRRVSRELGLPQDAWVLTDARAAMTCLTFRVTVDARENGFTLSGLGSVEDRKNGSKKGKERPD